MDRTFDIIIVGAGPAGMTAAIYAIRANMKVLMLDRLSPGGQMINTNEVENYTGTGKLSGADLAIKMFEHTQELGVEFDYKTVIDITDDGLWKTITCEEDHTAYKARAVILATGRFLSGGLEAHRNGIKEHLLDLPVVQAADRGLWYEERYTDPKGHAIHRAGIEVDAAFRPLGEKGQPFNQCLFAAGIILAHQDWIRGRSGAGIAIASAYRAVTEAERFLLSQQ